MEVPVLTVYGADWCEDTQRSMRYLRRVRVPYDYRDVDVDAAALEQAKALNHGRRRTPIVQVQGEVLVEPSIRTLTEALIRNGLLDRQVVAARLHRRNVGDVERGIRLGGAVAASALSVKAPKVLKIPLLVLGAYSLLSGLTGWCLLYSGFGVTSLGGPVDHPMEAERESWLAPDDAWTGQQEVE